VKEAGVYRLLVRNLVRGLSEADVMPYRLAVRKESPDFRLAVIPVSPLPDPKDSKDVPIWSTLLRRGGVTPIEVVAVREDGFAGEIQLSVDGLPPGVTAGPASISPAGGIATILLSATDNAAHWVGPIHVTGTAKVGAADVRHAAVPGTVNLSAYDGNTKVVVVRSRVTDEFVLAVSDAETAPISIAPATQPVFETSVAGKLSIPLKFTRRAEFVGPMSLKLAGHPAVGPTKEISVEPKVESAALELDLTQVKLPPGQYTLHAVGQGKLKYINNPEAPKIALAAVQEAQKKAADLALAVKTLEEVTVDAGKANDAPLRAATEKVVAEVKRRAVAVEAEKAAAQARANEATAKAQPRDVTASFYSPTFVVKITAAPVTFAAASPAMHLAVSGKIELPVAINRLYGFADAVTIHLAMPPTAQGITAADITLAKGQSQAKLMVQTDKTAKPGGYAGKLQAKLKLNGQDLQIEQDVLVKVLPAATP
jgi:hypothetical protein